MTQEKEQEMIDMRYLFRAMPSARATHERSRNLRCVSVLRMSVAIAIALIPMLIVAATARLTGITDTPNAIGAVICTAMLLGFAAYRRRDWMRQ